MARKGSGRDVDGNAMMSAQLYQRQMIALAEQLVRFERIVETLDDEDVWLQGMSIKFKGYERESHLIVLRAIQSDAKVVAFQDGDTLAEALRQLCARLENRSIKWKEDQYG